MVKQQYTDMASPRIVYMGTPEFAVEPLAAIVDAGYNVVAVVTVPDKPVGRGQKLQASPVKQFAEKHGLPLLQPDKLRDEGFINLLKQLNPDIGAVVAFRMLPESVWCIPRLGTFNLHASLLPQYRGAAPINWAIINGERKTGLTTFFLDREMDTGIIISRQEVDIAEDETAGELHNRLMHLGANMVVNTVQLLAEGNFTPISQDRLAAGQKLNPAPKIFRETCRINWNLEVDRVYNLIRGLSPYPAAWSEMLVNADGNEVTVPVKVFRAERVVQNHKNSFGAIVTDGKRYLQVASGKGYIDIKVIQQSGKKSMPIDEFLRGWHNAILVRML